MIRIAIADDHQLVLDGLKAVITATPGFEFVAEANDGKRLLEIVKAIQVDIALIDIDMPVMSGVQAMEEIKQVKPEVKMVALTMHNEKGMIQRVISAGASGYMLKNIDHEELIGALKKIEEGGKYFSEDVTVTLAGGKSTFYASNSVQNQTITSGLTEREIEILTLIAKGFSNKEIGDQLFISHRTVDTHRTNLMKKIDVKNIAGLIRYAIRNGYVE